MLCVILCFDGILFSSGCMFECLKIYCMIEHNDTYNSFDGSCFSFLLKYDVTHRNTVYGPVWEFY